MTTPNVIQSTETLTLLLNEQRECIQRIINILDNPLDNPLDNQQTNEQNIYTRG